MELRIFQKGFNYSQDGPGNRLVLHLQGCNLHCTWCANPEGMPVRPPLMQVQKTLPDGICPHGAIINNTLDRTVCASCTGRECVSINRNTALVCRCETYSVEQVTALCLQSRPMFFDGGGVTLTGGEVSMQLPAVKELLGHLHAAGVHTAIETNATHPALATLYPELSLLIADCKHVDPAIHKRVTGQDNAQVLPNLREALRRGVPLWIRIPLIGGFNTAPEDPVRFAQALAPLLDDGPFTVECLRYHEYGRDKWTQCGLSYPMRDKCWTEAGGPTVDEDTVRVFENTFRAAGLTVSHT